MKLNRDIMIGFGGTEPSKIGLSPDEIKEGNKIIAGFMDLEFLPGDDTCYVIKNMPHINGSCIVNIDQLSFHESWDWLMNTIDQIEREGFYTTIGLTEDKHNCYIYNEMVSYMRGSENVVARADFKYENKIDAVFCAVVDFIKWYNSQQQDNGTN